jgi:FimV-like protein
MNKRIPGTTFLFTALVGSLLLSFHGGPPAYCQPRPDVLTLIDEGVRYELESKFDQAIETYRKVLEIDGLNAFAKIHIAKLMSWKNRFDEALAMLDEVIAEDPGQLEAIFRKAQILSWQGKFEESIDAYKVYLSFQKNDLLGLMGLARVYFWSGAYGEAIQYFNIAIDKGADEAEARLELAKVYLAMDDKETAKAELERVLKLDHENAEAKRFLEGIPKLTTLDVSIVGYTLEIYPDGSTGMIAAAYITYHHKQTWDFTYRIEDEASGGARDATLGFTFVYRRIRGLYLLGDLSIYPDPDFSPIYGVDLGANYMFKNGFGLGMGLSAEVYGDAPLATVQNETLFSIKPKVIKYFGGVGNVILGYDQYIYSGGYTAQRVNMGVAVEYLPGYLVSGSFSYGGDIEIRDSERRVFEFGAGTSLRLVEGFSLSLYYNLVETKYGRTHQIGFAPLIQW